MRFVFDVPERPHLPIAGREARFPVHRVYCVGMNYADHIREMGKDPDRDPPLFFMKAPDCIVDAAQPVDLPYPAATQDLHHEVELVLCIGEEARDLTPETAIDCLFGYTVGIDFTRRDLQAAAKAGGRPWDPAKTFDRAGPCAPIRQGGDLPQGAITLDVNGKRRQDGRLTDMIWSVPELLSHLSRLFTLRPGDLVFTGTPAGVGPVVPGDVITAAIEGLGSLEVTVCRD